MFLFANKMDLFIGQSTGNDGDDEAGAVRDLMHVGQACVTQDTSV